MYPLLVLEKRKVCLTEACDYDKSMAMALPTDCVDIKDLALLAVFPNKFSTHKHKCKIVNMIKTVPNKRLV